MTEHKREQASLFPGLCDLSYPSKLLVSGINLGLSFFRASVQFPAGDGAHTRCTEAWGVNHWTGLPGSPREFCFLSSNIPNALVWETENICVYFYF